MSTHFARRIPLVRENGVSNVPSLISLYLLCFVCLRLLAAAGLWVPLAMDLPKPTHKKKTSKSILRKWLAEFGYTDDAKDVGKLRLLSVSKMLPTVCFA